MARGGGKPQPTITDDRALGSAVIKQSLRIDQGASDLTGSNYSRTPSSAGNRKTFTISLWVKKCGTPGNIGDGDDQYSMFSTGGGGSGAQNGNLLFYNDDSLYFVSQPQPSANANFVTTRKFRDENFWYHIVVAVDTTQATQSNRVKIYINGVQETSFSTETYPSQNADLQFNQAERHRIGSNSLGSDLTASYGNFNGYFAEYNFVDGQALDPSSFGFTDPQTGIWMPKRYEGTYGTNGFYLDFSDNTSTTTLGIDKSPNGNDFTPEDASTGDLTLDSPSNNFATLRYMSGPPSSGSSLSEGNLKFTTGSSGSARNLNRQGISTLLPKSGKWYAEVRVTGGGENNFVGVGPYQIEISPTSNNTRYVYYYGPSGEVYQRTAGSESNASHGAGFGNDDIVGIYIDMDASTPLVYFSKNGQWANGSGSNNQANPTSAITLGNSFFTESTGGDLGIGIIVCSSASSDSTSYQANFGQDSTFSGLITAGGNKDDRGIGDFKYPVPSGALALCSKNMPLTAPSIVRPQKHFECLTYTGTTTGSGTQTISDLEFAPDFVWIKSRAIGYSHLLVDTVRGASKGLLSEDTDVEETSNQYGMLTSFGSNGFTMTRGSSDGGKCCENTQTYVAWCWKAGGAAVSNSDGSITSSVSANQEGGFSIVTYAGNGTTGATVGHGLGKVPAWVIIKCRSHTDDWMVYHQGVDYSAPEDYYLKLNSNGASVNSVIMMNDTAPTTSVFSLQDDSASNSSGRTYVAYCWSEIPGFSKFGSYTGNGSSDGRFVDLGFRPAWVMIKRTTGTQHWRIFDNKRNTFNDVDLNLTADHPQAEFESSAYNALDFLSNGFKLVGTNADEGTNQSGQSYIYMAFAEQPGLTPFDAIPNAR